MSFLNAYLEGYTPATCPPFKMVFCVNCKADQKELLETFRVRWDELKANDALPEKVKKISIMTSAWSGRNFPYGKIRNELLHSKESQHEIKAFQAAGFYPYVAIGDADTGSRLVAVDEQINHVFAAIQQRLNRKLDSPYPSSPSRSKNSPSSKKSPSGNGADEVIDEHSDSSDNRMEVQVNEKRARIIDTISLFDLI